jgi:bacillithiol system protein YtxJ
MGFLNSLFGNSGSSSKETSKNAVPWKQLSTIADLEHIEKRSFERPQLIFKHSTSCGISRMVLRVFESAYDLGEEEADVFYLDLLSFRSVSNEVGYKFQVLHQSPQLLVIKDGQTVTHASHGAISDIELRNYL